MSLLLLFPATGETPPTPVTSTALLEMAFEHTSTAGDIFVPATASLDLSLGHAVVGFVLNHYAAAALPISFGHTSGALLDVSSTAALAMEFGHAADDFLLFKEREAAFLLEFGHTAGYEKYNVRTAAVGMEFGHAVKPYKFRAAGAALAIALGHASSFMLTKYRTVLLPMSFGHTMAWTLGPGGFISDSINLEVLWAPARVRINDENALMAIQTVFPVSIKAHSSAGAVLYYRTKLDSGAWSEWLAYVEPGGKRGANGMVISYDFLSYGDHTLYAEARDDDLNIWDFDPSYITITSPTTEPPIWTGGGGDIVPTRVVPKIGRRGKDPVPVRVPTSAEPRR